MLENAELFQKVEKEDYKAQIEPLRLELGKLQRACKDLEIPVMIVFEGFDASGKGKQIAELIEALDPRGFDVYAVKKETEEEKRYPFLWRFWTKTPEKGKIAIYDTSWYRKVLTERFEKSLSKKELKESFRSIRSFEQQLTADGTVLIKLFLCIDRKEQEKRFRKLREKKETKWRVTKEDLERNRRFDEFRKLNEEMLEATDLEEASWQVIGAKDRRFATLQICRIVAQKLEEAVRFKETCLSPKECTDSSDSSDGAGDSDISDHSDGADSLNIPDILTEVDLTKSCTRQEYEKRLQKLQRKLSRLHGELYRKKIPMVLCFEGWDAGGKGGAIHRLTEKMDPRGYAVHPTAAPNDVEKAHHYLWRFWRAMPKTGHVTIFDRTWYGRVMVERVEGFCTSSEWKRAYREINDMEQDLLDAGTIVLKFWLHIDKEEQEKRFRAREENPEKCWKITDEDWRNREKWDAYERAVNEMLFRTSRPEAPWIVVEGNDKYYARLKVLETVVKAIEERI